MAWQVQTSEAGGISIYWGDRLEGHPHGGLSATEARALARELLAAANVVEPIPPTPVREYHAGSYGVAEGI